MTEQKKGKTTWRRPLLQKEIEHAQSMTVSGTQAANYLNVSYPMYKKYAQMYGIYDKHKATSKGITRNRKLGNHGLHAILDNKHPHYDLGILMIRLLKAGYLPQECSQCGFKEQRVNDGRSPLRLRFKDEEGNYNLNNLELLCHNCIFLISDKVIIKEPRQVDLFNKDLFETGALTMEDIESLQNEILSDLSTEDDL